MSTDGINELVDDKGTHLARLLASEAATTSEVAAGLAVAEAAAAALSARLSDELDVGKYLVPETRKRHADRCHLLLTWADEAARYVGS